MDFADFLDSDDEKMENNEADASDVSKIYSGDFQSGKEQLTQIPRGWLRRIVTSGSGATLQRNVCYISPAGQKFFSHATLEQHFARLGQSVMSGLFNFEPPQLVDEDEDDEEELEKCSTSSLQQHQQHQQQQQQQHLTSLSTKKFLKKQVSGNQYCKTFFCGTIGLSRTNWQLVQDRLPLID